MTNLIREFLDRSHQKRLNIKCVGDTMIDEYYQVAVDRISPEFPMPIMASKSEECESRPGGVANVACQLKHFNTAVELGGLTDIYLEGVMHEQFPDCVQENFEMDSVAIPIKKRFLVESVQVNRWDVEQTNYGLSDYDLEHAQDVAYECAIKNPADVVILSDYNKGFFNSKHNWISAFPNAITIVDPKKGPLTRWKGCTVFKPNAKEAKDLSGYSNWQDQAKSFYIVLGCQSVVMTHGGDGVRGIHKGEIFEFIPDEEVKVRSVVGAGDCFCAIFAMAVGLGMEAPKAAQVAWKAGSVYVQHGLNKPISPAELLGGVVQPYDLTHRNFKLVLANGCFDMLHSGHISLLKFAKSKGEKLVVAVNSDASVKRLKGESRPMMPLAERMNVLANLKDVDFVVSFEEDTPYEIMKVIKPDVIIKGAEYQSKEIIGADLAEVCLAPMIPNVSTTKLLAK